MFPVACAVDISGKMLRIFVVAANGDKPCTNPL